MISEHSDFARQHRRILKQYGRCQSAYTMGDQIGVFSQDKFEAENVEQLFSNFFIETYHLKDYIKNDKMIPAKAASNVEKYINNSRPLALAGDIANSEKHLRLSTSRTGKNVRLRTTPIICGPIGSFPIGGLYKFAISIETDNPIETIDALELANQCISEWQKFITKYKLDY